MKNFILKSMVVTAMVVAFTSCEKQESVELDHNSKDDIGILDYTYFVESGVVSKISPEKLEETTSKIELAQHVIFNENQSAIYVSDNQLNQEEKEELFSSVTLGQSKLKADKKVISYTLHIFEHKDFTGKTWEWTGDLSVTGQTRKVKIGKLLDNKLSSYAIYVSYGKAGGSKSRFTMKFFDDFGFKKLLNTPINTKNGTSNEVAQVGSNINDKVSGIQFQTSKK